MPQDALTAGLEAGVSTIVFAEGQAALAREWQQLGRFDAVTRTADGRLLGADGTQVSRFGGAALGVRDASWLQRQHQFQHLNELSGSSLSNPPQVGKVRLLASPEDLRAAEREAAAARGVVVMDASDWQVRLSIPAHTSHAKFDFRQAAGCPASPALPLPPASANPSREDLRALTGTQGA